MRFFEGLANTAKLLHELALLALGMATRAGSRFGRLRIQFSPRSPCQKS